MFRYPIKPRRSLLNSHSKPVVNNPAISGVPRQLPPFISRYHQLALNVVFARPNSEFLIHRCTPLLEKASRAPLAFRHLNSARLVYICVTWVTLHVKTNATNFLAD
jgi:hypothetical protein